MATSSLLLKGGIVLTHGADDHVKPIKADLLIEGNKIAKIAENISTLAAAQVIDCTDKILSPGFVDTHHHVWQSALKGRHADQLVLDYSYTGILQSSNYTPEDIFWGQLGGCLEAIDVGTTTVVDHAHMNYSPEHVRAAIAATTSSGIRSIFGYCPTMRLESWSPFAMNMYLLEPWVMETLGELASKAPFGNGRVTLGFAFDGWFLPKEMVLDVFDKVKKMGIKFITTHYVRGALSGTHSIPALMESYGLLSPSVLFSHATNATPQDASLLLAHSAHVSSTPSTELQMGLGTPICFDASLSIQSQCSLGIDCHTNNSASIPSEMRIALQSSRGLHNAPFIAAGKIPAKLNATVEQAFNLGTIHGARAVGMEAQIGSLAVGKLADVVVFDALSPGMVCGAQQDPVAAIVLHSSPGDVLMTVVDGVVRKRDGKLLDTEAVDGAEKFTKRESATPLSWMEVARKLLTSREGLQEKIDGLDFVAARKGVLQAYQVDPDKIVAEV